jgi:Domain of unknown function (DUF1413)
MPHPHTSDMITHKALHALDAQPAGREFKLKDLFSEEEWQAFPRGSRQAAGKKFKQAVLRNAELQGKGPDSANHQHYAKPPE